MDPTARPPVRLLLTRGGAGLLFLATILAALGGAARTPEGVVFGWPGTAGTVVAVLAAAAFVLLARQPRCDVTVAYGLLPMGLVLVFPGWAGARAVSGTIVLFAVLAVAAAGLLRGWRPPRRLLFPAFLVLYLAASARMQLDVGPQGDEPHYLMVADSLLRDGDLFLDRDYAERRYEAFHSGTLEPHFRSRAKGGQIVSLHAVGLSILILPAYALGGYPAVSFFMAFLAALLVLQIRALVEETTGEPGWGEAVAWTAGLSAPLAHFAGLVFTEVAAALIVVASWRMARRAPELSWPKAVTLGLLLVALPWLNVRYALLSGILGVFALAGRPSRAAAASLAGTGFLGLLGLVGYHKLVFGFWDPRRVYGGRLDFSWSGMAEGLPGLLLDQEFGLLAYAPILVLAFPGLHAWIRRDRRNGLLAAALVTAVLGTAASWHMWRGGFNPPARFLVPLMGPLWAAVAIWVRGRPWAAVFLLAGWGVFTGLAGATEPPLVHRDRDETAPFFRAYSGAEEWTRLLPAYVLAEPDRARLTAVWAGLLMVAAIRRRAPAGPIGIGLGLGLVTLIAAAGLASMLSDGRTGGRDAVRVVGTRGTARWSTADLGWGPLYEPHRFPAGAPLGERLRLPAGTYTFEIQGETFGGQPGTLVVSGAPPVELQPGQSTGVQATFEVREGVREVTLGLLGGSSRTVTSLNLSLAPRSNRLNGR